MLEQIIKLKERNNSVKELNDYIRQGMPSAVFGVSDAFKNYIVSTIDSPVLYVVRDNVSARMAVEGIGELCSKKVVYIPPKDETLLTSKAFSKDNTYARITALSQIKSADVVITTAEALMQIAPNKIEDLTLKKYSELSQEFAISTLVRMGYERVEAVESKGTFALRGDILDVFPINSENPYRVDFFGDNVESIKGFDAETRENLGYVDCICILQAVEFTFSEDDVNLFKSKIRNELKLSPKQAKERLKIILDDIEVAMENLSLSAFNALAPLSKDCGDIFDYIQKDAVVVFDEAKRINEVALLNEKEFNERFESLYSSGEVFSFAKKNLTGLDAVISRLKDYREVALQSLSTVIPFFNPLKIVNPESSGVSDYQLDFKEVFTDINNWLKGGYSITVCTGDAKKADNFCLELSSRGIASSIDVATELKGVSITTEKLSKGFIFHEEKAVVIGSGNLFSKPVSSRRLKTKKKGFFTAPEVGDFCVHEIHGIGRVLGNKKISSTEGTKDYVAVEYSGGDVLYVPVEQMDILTRYLGGDKKPRLSKIGGKDFERIKKNVKESIKKMSFDLKRLYQEREELKGYKFTDDGELQTLFENSFPFEDTPDQAIANADIKADMTSGRVMDRLVCGDVGFGKTEVALRAVFRAIVNGKQAAMLAPTTILTEQHYNTALERFGDFGVKIACLNRFKTPKQQQKKSKLFLSIFSWVYFS